MPSSLRQAPVTFGLIVLCTVVFLLFYGLNMVSLLQLFNFVPFTVNGSSAQLGEPGGQWWRFVTPSLIHFSWMHLVFNSLWLWEFGRRIEARMGSLNLLGLYLVSAIFSNSVQYFWAGPSLFGGMSGVVYAFMGFIWIANRLHPGWILPLPQALFGFMLAWLLIGLTGALEFFGLGAIANGAHVGGLVIGLVLGSVIALFSRLLGPGSERR